MKAGDLDLVCVSREFPVDYHLEADYLEGCWSKEQV